MATLKETAQEFLMLCARGDSREAFAKYAHTDFKHHNAYFKGDAHTLMVAMEEAHRQTPNKEFRMLRALEDGDLVAIHSIVKQDPTETGYIVMHIMRFEEGKIIELWDFGQEIPRDMPNEHGMI